MRGDFFDFPPTHKLWIVGNHKPSLRSVDEAMRRRLLLTPFTVTIPEAERDPQLSEKLKPEHPAILRWMIDGCLQWRETGLVIPKVVREASDGYFAEQDDITAWLEDCTERKPRAFTPSSSLFRSWQTWCSECGVNAGKQTGLTEALQDRGYIYKPTNKARGFLHLALKGGGETQMEADLDGAPSAASSKADDPGEPLTSWEADELRQRGFSNDELFAMPPPYARQILADPKRSKLSERYGFGADAPADTLCRICKEPGARLFSEPITAGVRPDRFPGMTPLHLKCCPKFFESSLPMED